MSIKKLIKAILPESLIHAIQSARQSNTHLEKIRELIKSIPPGSLQDAIQSVHQSSTHLKEIRELIQAVPPESLIDSIQSARQSNAHLREIQDLILAFQTNELQRSHPNPLNSSGGKCFSQTDEDGITLEILKRIKCINNGTFAEFGVGNGTENNTLILKALGWKGFWVGGENLAFDIRQPKEIFSYFKNWITLENIASLANEGKRNIGAAEIDVISLDLDGNDIYFVEKLLSNGFAPKLFIIEYNAKFLPPIEWQIDYDPAHTWQGDDYYGASLTSFVGLFKKYGFRLICCNSHTGANAFFLREEFSTAFSDIPTDIGDIYVAPRYYLYTSYGHPASVKTIAKLFS
jgi:hypothetical protein